MSRAARIATVSLSLLLSAALCGGIAARARGQAPASTATEVTGHVLNARTHQPIARALVRLGDRAVLTNHDGVFDFPQVTATTGVLTVARPGFFAGSEPNDPTVKVYQITGSDPIELLLYPEAIVSGVVTNALGEGLPNLNVTARRSSFDDTGHHWRPMGSTRTESDGSYRLALMAGDYAIQVRAMGRARPGAELVLPVSLPADSSSLTEAIHLSPGDEYQADLHPDIRKAYEVTFAEEAWPKRGMPTLTAHGGNGLTIPLIPMPSRSEPGSFSVILPAGNFNLSGVIRTPDGDEEAEGSVTVPEHNISGVGLHFAKTPVLPVELSIDPSATSDNTTTTPQTPSPTPQTMGLLLSSVSTMGEMMEQSFSPVQKNQSFSFSVPSGTYRLHARSAGQWFVSEASCGGSDLLSKPLVVSPGMGSVPIRVLVSNAFGSLSGSLKLAGQPASGWVYLVSTTPSGTPLVIFRVGASGDFTRSYVPPGSWRVVALERRIGADFENPATMTAFLDRAQSFSLAPGGKQTLNLEVVPAGELPQ